MDKKQYAFPSKEIGINDNAGLTKREYVATEVLKVLIGKEDGYNLSLQSLKNTMLSYELSEAAFLISDSFLKQGKDSSAD